MYSSTANQLHTIKSFSQAKTYFESQPQRRGKVWQPHQRPLRSDKGGPRLYHYRIEKHKDGAYYDIVLYSTVMARFYAPDADGAERRLYMGDARQLSRQFMWHVFNLNQINRIVPLNGDQRIIMPIYHYSREDIGEDQPFSLEAWFVDGRLDTSRSKHTQHYVRRSDKNDRQAKADTLRHFDTYVLMAMMRLPEYESNVNFDYNKGRPFGGDAVTYQDRAHMQRMLMAEPTQEDVDWFFEFGQSVFDVLASKRACSQTGFTIARSWYNNATKANTYNDLENKITPEEFRKSFINKIADALQLHNKSMRVDIPQFVVESDFPATAIRLAG
jgi:hypothetical protein